MIAKTPLSKQQRAQVDHIRLQANLLGNKLFAVIEDHGPPTPDAIAAACAAIAHVAALVICTQPAAEARVLAAFLNVLGQEVALQSERNEPIVH